MTFKKKLKIANNDENGNCKESPQREKPQRKSSPFFRQMLGHCEPLDGILLFCGISFALVSGICWPTTVMILGDMADVFLQYEYQTKHSKVSTLDNLDHTIKSNQTHDRIDQQFLGKVHWFAGQTYALAVLYLVGHFVTMLCFQLYAARQVRIIKHKYFKSILRQEIGWHDRQNSGEFASRISSEFKKFEIGINENLGMLIYNIVAGLIHIGISFYVGWKLTLVVIAISPILLIVSIAMEKFQAHYMLKEMNANAAACASAEEVISSIRTVFAFSGQNRERKRYKRLLKPAMKNCFMRNFVSSIASATMWGTFYLGQALGIWFGMQLIADPNENYSVGIIVIVMWSIADAGFNIADSAPFIESFQNAKTASTYIFQVIERQSEVDSLNDDGKRLPKQFRTNIEFKNVCFAYPTRSDVQILKKFNLTINSGEIVALVGSSGCGKSTLIQLIQRFYDPVDGEILLDGVDIKELNVGWLREQFGVVGQEPVLFDDSIEQNIRLGVSTDQIKTVSNEEIQLAAREANADDFIIGLPEGYSTYVGDRGAQMSGGQKQRIAIARALISKPRILLLDEATSALDLESEHVVQTALDRASKGRTTIIVAHRLSTIINADRIIYIDDGKVREMGTHQELMNLQSAYYSLVMAQQQQENEEIIPLDQLKFSQSNIDFENKTTKPNQKRKSLSHSIQHRTKSGHRGSSLNYNPKSIHFDEMSEEELKKWNQTSFPYGRVFCLIWNDKFYLIFAMLAASLYGLLTPLYALIYGTFLDVFSQSNNVEHISARSFECSMLFVGFAVLIFFACIVQITFFGIVGGKFIMKLRTMVYSAILNQDIAWFDLQENSSGALCARLEDDVANLEGATGQRISIMCQAIVTLIAAVTISFIYNWRLAFVTLFLMPFIGVTSMITSTIYEVEVEDDSLIAEISGKLTIEAMGSIRTVTSLHKEQYFLDKFVQNLTNNFREMAQKAPVKAIIFAVSIAVPLAAYATVILYGGYLISWGYLKYADFFRISESMIFGAMVLGETSVITGDFIKAKISAINIFKIIDQKPQKLFTENGDGSGHDDDIDQKPFHSDGNISFRGIHFNYPNRVNSKVLNGLSFRASQGETVALVGSSGCGKSTTIQLLERFYDCSKGKILLDGENINRLNVEWLRSQMALVSQEPILFNYSIKENIAYGDNSRSVIPFDEIVRASQMANIHEFIRKLPQGYDTPVGGKGSQLSGGQKQRIAIARSLIRNPKILLLDEATSALDTESEKVVQQALDEASKGRTCIVIAHRLRTIINADKIVVINRGENVEEGTHEELFARKGYYWKLYNSAH